MTATGRVSFDLHFLIKGGEQIPELAARLSDLRPAFEVIVQKWAKENESKFDAAEGMEAGGAQVDETVFWEALQPSTMRAKRRKGQGDNIMVATGELKQALTDPDRFFHAETESKAVFGTPMAFEDELKLRYNWQKRQTVFLGGDDQRMIEQTMQAYLSLGADFEQIRFAKGLQNLKNREEVARMEMDFGNTAGD
jgi:hypothetical protein